ncbi:MAG: hypothetical protein K9J42_09100 [Sulfuritalea sp.]|nr:hypothetical protein [Sulfuritalea sp.]
MKSDCAAIQYMTMVAGEEASRFPKKQEGTFTSALNIILDIQEYGMTPTDAEILHGLVDSICSDGHGALRSLIRAEAPDCEVCAALAKRMDINQARGSLA